MEMRSRLRRICTDMESDADLTRLLALYGGTGCGGISFSLTVTHRLTKTKMQKLAADGVVPTELRSRIMKPV